MSKDKQQFKIQDIIVYPSHGVGTITEIAEQNIATFKLQLLVIYFEKEKMTIRVPVEKANSVGLRHLVSKDEFEKSFEILKADPKERKGMWNKIAQHLEAKLYSGEPIHLAEVIRDLRKNANHPERSFSERSIYESALNRYVAEYAAICQISFEDAMTTIRQFIDAKEAA